MHSQTQLFTADNDIITDTKFMQSLIPFPEGSENEKVVIKFIETRLSLLKVAFVSRGFEKAVNSHSFSRTIEVDIAGERDETIVICIPVNSLPVSGPDAGDPSFNIALGLSIISQYQSTPPPVSLKVLFLGAQKGVDPGYPLGTRLFLETFYPEQPHIFLSLDMTGIPSTVRMETGSRGLVSPSWILSRMTAAFRSSAVAYMISNTDIQVIRTGLSSRQTPITPYMAKGYPAIGLEGLDDAADDATRLNRALRIKKSLINFIISFYSGFPGEWDYHYLFFHNSLFDLLVSETEYIIILIGGCALFILLAFFRIREMRKYWETIRRNIFAIPLFFLFAFLLLLVASFLLDATLMIRGVPSLWTWNPAAFLLLKISLYLFFSTILFKFLKNLPFPKNGSFYTAASLLFTVLSLISIMAINISFAYYFLWSLFCIVLFSFAKKPMLKIIAFAAAPLSLAGIIGDIFSTPYLSLCQIILFNKVGGNILFAIIILPFTLLLIRIRLLFRYRARSFFTRRSFIFLLLAFSILLSLGIFVLFYSPFSKENPAPVSAVRTVDFDEKTHVLEFQSPIPLGSVTLRAPDKAETIETDQRRYLFTFSAVNDYFKWSLSQTAFLNRKTVLLSLAMSGTVSSVSAEISAQNAFVLYDCNFPFQKIEGQNAYRIFIGKNPPSALALELTLPPGRDYSVACTLSYTNPPDALDASVPDSRIEYSLVFKKRIIFGL